MIVIGADTHKGSHALVAVDEATGKERGSRQIKADDAGHLAAVRGRAAWTRSGCGRSRTAGMSRDGSSRRLAAGEQVVRVPPHRMGASRNGEREPGKSDEI
jgi:transposase